MEARYPLTMARHSQNNGNSRWQKIAAIGASIPIGVAIISLLWRSFSLDYSVQQQGLKNAEYDRRINELEGKIAVHSADLAALKRDLNEIETQFCESDHLRNLMHAEELRRYATIYEKVYGTIYPITNVYYPIVCNRKAVQ